MTEIDVMKNKHIKLFKKRPDDANVKGLAARLIKKYNYSSDRSKRGASMQVNPEANDDFISKYFRMTYEDKLTPKSHRCPTLLPSDAPQSSSVSMNDS